MHYLLSNPMILAIVIGIIMAGLFVITFVSCKPKVVTKINDDHKHVINWPRLLLLSFILGLSSTIITVILFVKKTPKIQKSPMFGFTNVY